MRFSTFVLFASSFASSLAAPAVSLVRFLESFPSYTLQPENVRSVDTLTSGSSDVITYLTRLHDVGAQIKTSTSTPDTHAAVTHIDNVVGTLIPSGLLDGLSGGLLGGLLGGGLLEGGLGDLLGGNGRLLGGLLPGDLLGGLLGSSDGGLLGGVLGDGGLLGGLLGGGSGGLLGGLLGGGGGGLLGGLLGGGNGGLLVSITGLLDLFPGLSSSCGTDLLGELLEIVQGLVASLNVILPDAQQCGCGQNQALKANVAAMIKANEDKLGPLNAH
ncbi:hypothetical protein B0H16DRAFT_1694047 [Mycena metata]|uniref:Uncharacterized protein n=1 Tax=Mycena metata TaxID=1033252 RepID=A0AAD7N1C9_9AGAR|nr:hypothetical protein B0H16DRAFT_1694047 [Mycena metata]